ncbi:MAG: hypothetical protein ACRDJB_14230 [Actinomycetota bacterium]
MKKLLLVAVLVVILVAAMVSPALAHFVHVETPSGQTNCQFLGGPGNPGHAGHANGHPQAIAHSGSDTATFAGPC